MAGAPVARRAVAPPEGGVTGQAFAVSSVTASSYARRRQDRGHTSHLKRVPIDAIPFEDFAGQGDTDVADLLVPETVAQAGQHLA